METRVLGLDELDFAYGVAHHKEHCRRLITDNGFTTICEIGGGRAPLFSREEASTMGLDYTVLDISDKELRAAPDHVRKIEADIGALDLTRFSQRYDFMFSRMLAEHVRDGTAMHRNVLQLLRPGGMAFHFFPTLFTPAFVANRLLPGRGFGLNPGQERLPLAVPLGVHDRLAPRLTLLGVLLRRGEERRRHVRLALDLPLGQQSRHLGSSEPRSAPQLPAGG